MLENNAIISNNITISLLSYMYRNGVRDISVRIKNEEEKIVIIAEGKTNKEPEDIDELNRLLNNERLPSIAGYYGNMLGISEDVNDINLLSSLVDEGMIIYHDNILSFYASRFI
ncbi:MAG: hypothetical protein Q4E02_03805 [Lagierella massiliensis]|nr:hypothetical protein [Lagierella massiliensis]